MLDNSLAEDSLKEGTTSEGRREASGFRVPVVVDVSVLSAINSSLSVTSGAIASVVDKASLDAMASGTCSVGVKSTVAKRAVVGITGIAAMATFSGAGDVATTSVAVG